MVFFELSLFVFTIRENFSIRTQTRKKETFCDQKTEFMSCCLIEQVWDLWLTFKAIWSPPVCSCLCLYLNNRTF
jgi:hypothetical protein